MADEIVEVPQKYSPMFICFFGHFFLSYREINSVLCNYDMIVNKNSLISLATYPLARSLTVAPSQQISTHSVMTSHVVVHVAVHAILIDCSKSTVFEIPSPERTCLVRHRSNKRSRIKTAIYESEH